MTTNTRICIIAIGVLSAIAQPAAAEPAWVDDALRIVGSARQTVAEIPVLTGTEGFSIDTFRQMLMDSRGATPYESFVTAQAVVEVANTAGTTVEQLTVFNIGWAALEVNWVFASLLGETADATLLLGESNKLINYQSIYMANVQQGSASFVSYYPKIEANNHALNLRRTASEMNLISLIPNAMDPEGFLRQRLQVTYNRLTNAAEFIHNAGESFSFYY